MRLLKSLLIALLASPVASVENARHPSIDALNKASSLLEEMSDRLENWSGKFDQALIQSELDQGHEMVGQLQIAATTLKDGGNLDYFSSGFPLLGAYTALNRKTHDFVEMVISKIDSLKQAGVSDEMYRVVDQAFREMSAFLAAAQLQGPSWMAPIAKPFFNELLGTLSQAVEVLRPKQEVIVVIVPNPNGTFSSYTMTNGASQQTYTPSLTPS
jgi:hypothetical protein